MTPLQDQSLSGPVRTRGCYPDSVYPKSTVQDIEPVAGTGKGVTQRQRVFGDRIRARRLKIHLTQEGLAFASGLHRTYIASLECGDRNPSLETIVRLANALEIDAGVLVAGLGKLRGRG